MELSRVDKTKFNKFIRAYPNPLEYENVTICDPPITYIRDESLTVGNRLVAKVYCEWMSKGEVDSENHKRFWRYHINGDE